MPRVLKIGLSAFGNYNDLVLEASGVRGQSVVNWDFEYAESRGPSIET